MSNILRSGKYYLSKRNSIITNKSSVSRYYNSSQLYNNKNNSEKNPWKAQEDPEGSGKIYYWNTETDETTALGAPRPAHWVSVRDPNGSGLVYWWNPETNETTAVGAPKPNSHNNHIAAIVDNNVNHVNNKSNPTTSRSIMPFGNRIQQYQPPQQPDQPQTVGRSMVTFFTWGMGMTFAMVAVRAIMGF